MSEREQILEYIIQETLWMARRYAHKRHTFAPSSVNECIDLAIKAGIKIDREPEGHLYASDGDERLVWNSGMRMFEWIKDPNPKGGDSGE